MVSWGSYLISEGIFSLFREKCADSLILSCMSDFIPVIQKKPTSGLRCYLTELVYTSGHLNRFVYKTFITP